MANLKRPIAALVFGFAASVLLAAMEALYHNNAVAIAQFPGIAIGGQVGATEWAFEVVMMLVNTAFYAALAGVVLILLRVIEKLRS